MAPEALRRKTTKPAARTRTAGVEDLGDVNFVIVLVVDPGV